LKEEENNHQQQNEGNFESFLNYKEIEEEFEATVFDFDLNLSKTQLSHLRLRN